MANPFEITPVNPLQALMLGVQGYDAGQKRMKEAAQEAALREAGQLYAAGDLKGAQAAAARGGSLQALMGFAQLNNSDRDYNRAVANDARSQQNADRGFGLQEKQINATIGSTAAQRALAERQFQETVRMNNAQLNGLKTPAGFEANPNGGLRPIPGGPQDPAYLAETRKPLNLSVADVTKLSDEGGKLANLGRFIGTFKPEYAGKFPGTGDLSNWAARTLPSAVTGAPERDAAGWWQGYDRYKNVVRNDLFGSALTATEQAAFEKADINPSMNPELIDRNLKVQRDIFETGIRRKAGALVQAGHDPLAISKAYGIPPEALGVRQRGAPQPAQSQNDPLGIR